MDAKYKSAYEQAKQEWLNIWGFYQKLKFEKRLTDKDILEQLNIPFSPYALELLANDNLSTFMPSFKPGTEGKEMRELLLPGLDRLWVTKYYNFSPKIEEVDENEECFWE